MLRIWSSEEDNQDFFIGSFELKKIQLFSIIHIHFFSFLYVSSVRRATKNRLKGVYTASKVIGDIIAHRCQNVKLAWPSLAYRLFRSRDLSAFYLKFLTCLLQQGSAIALAFSTSQKNLFYAGRTEMA